MFFCVRAKEDLSLYVSRVIKGGKRGRIDDRKREKGVAFLFAQPPNRLFLLHHRSINSSAVMMGDNSPPFSLTVRVQCVDRRVAKGDDGHGPVHLEGGRGLGSHLIVIYLVEDEGQRCSEKREEKKRLML